MKNKIMKTIHLLSFTFLFALTINAQTFTVKYTMFMDTEALQDSLNKNEDVKKFLGDEMAKQIFGQMAKPQDYILTSSQGKSLYEIAPEVKSDEEEDELQVGGQAFNFNKLRRRFSPILFKDMENMTMTKQQGIFDKKFLIKDSLQTLDWEITDQTKKFGDFTCTVAEAMDAQNQKVSACYTEEVPINEGPDDYFGLPGLVIEVIKGPVHLNMSELKITDENTDLQAPKDGKEVTKKEFEDIVKERMKNVQGNGMSIFH